MSVSTSQQRVGRLPRTGRWAAPLEMEGVFLPLYLYLSLILGKCVGSAQVSLGSDLVLKGGPLACPGLIVALKEMSQWSRSFPTPTS